MKLISTSDVPKNVSQLVSKAMTQLSRQQRRRSRVLRVAVAAVTVLSLAMVAGVIIQTSSALALEDVVRQVAETKTLRAVVVDPHNGGTVLISGTRLRVEGPGVVMISDSRSGRSVQFDTRSKSAYRLTQQKMNSKFDVYGMIRSLTAAASKPIEDYVDKTGLKFPGFSGKTTLDMDGETMMTVEAKVWSNPKTRLPVRLEIQPIEGTGKAFLIEQMEFDIRLDDSLFDMTVPEEYTVVGLSEDELGPPPDEEEASRLTIVPGVGIGDVKFGMSREEIVARFGEPEVAQHGVYLTWASKGLQLVLVGREPDKLGMIIANPADAGSLTRNEFPGQTDKGICIGSSLQEVHDAYGKQDPPRDGRSDAEVASYAELGIIFSFRDGKVAQIMAVRTDLTLWPRE